MDEKILRDVVKIIEDRATAVTFTVEEIGDVLDRMVPIMVSRYEGTPAESVDMWGARVLADLKLAEERKRLAEHGPPPACGRCHPATAEELARRDEASTNNEGPPVATSGPSDLGGE